MGEISYRVVILEPQKMKNMSRFLILLFKNRHFIKKKYGDFFFKKKKKNWVYTRKNTFIPNFFIDKMTNFVPQKNSLIMKRKEATIRPQKKWCWILFYF